MRIENKTNPLDGLIGTWEGDRGTDIAPKPIIDENNPYYETLEFEVVDIDIENAEEQQLLAIKYYQLVREKKDDKVSHSETGYWIWNKDDDTIMCAFAIPRGVSVLAGGSYERISDEEIIFTVTSHKDDPNYGIVQSPFMEKKAKTIEFKREIRINGNKISYHQETIVDIYGKIFNHTDDNSLGKRKA